MSLLHTPRPNGYLGCVHGELQLLGQSFPITLLLYGHSHPLLEGGACTVLDGVKLDRTEISGHLPSEAFEVLTAHVNALPVAQ